MKTKAKKGNLGSGSISTVFIIISILISAEISFGQKKDKLGIHPVGRVKIRTEFPVKLSYDDTSFRINSLNQVVIKHALTGNHSIVFQSDSVKIIKTISIDPGSACYYKLRKDSTVSDSVRKGRMITRRSQKIIKEYLPFKRALFLQFKPGISFKNAGGGLDAKFMAGFYIMQKLSVGLGCGFTSTFKHFTNTYTRQTKSDNFPVSFMPVFANISYSFTKRQFTPFLSVDLGMSLPVTKEANGLYSDGGYGNKSYFRIDNMSPGSYLGLRLGLKYFLSPAIDLGGSLGVDLFSLKMTGIIYGPDSQYSQRPFHDGSTSACFTLNLVMGLNFLHW